MTDPTPHAGHTGNAYAEAGVSIDAADKAVELMKVWVDKARRPEMIGGIGGFAGLFDASALTRYTHPLLAPRAVVLDPAMTLGTPPQLWASTGMKAVDHAVEQLCHPVR
ncbi:MAG: iron-containing alcohol dehydrogenase, partial [Herbiconiux sp.]|nr:iron-containing alcohol dehydrogenase [Herbiconiux sp.]